MRLLIERLAIGALAVAGIVQAGILLPTAADLYRIVPEAGRMAVLTLSLSILIALIACGTAILLIARAGQRYEGRSLALFLVFVSLCWGAVLRFASTHIEAREMNVEANGWPLIISTYTLALATAALLRLSRRFPFDFAGEDSERGLLRRWVTSRWFPWALATAVPLLIQFAVPVTAGTIIALGIAEPGSAFPQSVVVSTLFTAFALAGLIVLGMVGWATVNFLAGYRRADEEARQPALWLVVGLTGASLTILAVVLSFVLDAALPADALEVPEWLPLLLVFAPLFAVICVAVAIFASGAVDPALALRKSTINGIAGTLGLLVFAGLENSLSNWVEDQLGFPGMLGSFLAGAAAAGVFLPVHRILTRRGDRSDRSSRP